jgi:hypothetical protein
MMNNDRLRAAAAIGIQLLLPPTQRAQGGGLPIVRIPSSGEGVGRTAPRPRAIPPDRRVCGPCRRSHEPVGILRRWSARSARSAAESGRSALSGFTRRASIGRISAALLAGHRGRRPIAQTESLQSENTRGGVNITVALHGFRPLATRCGLCRRDVTRNVTHLGPLSGPSRRWRR